MNAPSEFTIALVAALIVLVSVALILRLDIQKLGRTLSRLDARLDLLLKHAGIDPYKNLPREVVDAVQRGEKIQAIKHCREATGVSLREAKDVIENSGKSGPSSCSFAAAPLGLAVGGRSHIGLPCAHVHPGGAPQP